jgi:hypothetical protein
VLKYQHCNNTVCITELAIQYRNRLYTIAYRTSDFLSQCRRPDIRHDDTGTVKVTLSHREKPGQSWLIASSASRQSASIMAHGLRARTLFQSLARTSELP